jgi:hypothetical protein
VVVAAASAWQQEQQYVQRLLTEDVRNNSAWNQRFFILQVSRLRLQTAPNYNMLLLYITAIQGHVKTYACWLRLRTAMHGVVRQYICQLQV